MFCSLYITDERSHHERRSHEKLLLKLDQTRSDIYFLSFCKKRHFVANGLRLKKPIRQHPDNYVSLAVIYEASAKLSNVALHKAYAKQKRLSSLLEWFSLCINEIIHEPSHKTETFVFINELSHKKTFKLLS